MRELSLFSGAGGGLLGTKLLGWEHIGYVEWNEYCQKIIRQRIEDGILDRAPIFTDVREFVKSGAAREYRGFADVVTAGFPCQPHSRAGKQLGEEDNRDMWEPTLECISEVRPKFAYLENTPGIFDTGYVGRVTADLAALGYVGQYTVLSSAALGKDHRRNRWWCLAVDSHNLGNGIQGNIKEEVLGKQGLSWVENGGRIQDLRVRPLLSDPALCRSPNEFPCYMDRIKAIGNGQDASVVRAAWRILSA